MLIYNIIFYINLQIFLTSVFVLVSEFLSRLKVSDMDTNQPNFVVRSNLTLLKEYE